MDERVSSAPQSLGRQARKTAEALKRNKESLSSHEETSSSEEDKDVDASSDDSDGPTDERRSGFRDGQLGIRSHVRPPSRKRPWKVYDIVTKAESKIAEAQQELPQLPPPEEPLDTSDVKKLMA